MIRLHAPEHEHRDEQPHIEEGERAPVPLFGQISDTLPLSMDIRQVAVARRDADQNFLGWVIQQNF